GGRGNRPVVGRSLGVHSRPRGQPLGDHLVARGYLRRTRCPLVLGLSRPRDALSISHPLLHCGPSPLWAGSVTLSVVSTTPIADYALLSDRHSAALVSRDGSVDWLCLPRFDSPAVFARLLDDSAGHWSLRARDAQSVRRRYVDRTMVLETTHVTTTGTLVV